MGAAALAFTFSACGSTATNSNTTANPANKVNTNVTTGGNGNAMSGTNAAPEMKTNSNADTGASTTSDGEIRGDYMVGDVKCSIKPDGEGTVRHQVKCADNEQVQFYFVDTDNDKTILEAKDGKSRFTFDGQDVKSGTFKNAAGQTVTFNRVS